MTVLQERPRTDRDGPHRRSIALDAGPQIAGEPGGVLRRQGLEGLQESRFEDTVPRQHGPDCTIDLPFRVVHCVALAFKRTYAAASRNRTHLPDGGGCIRCQPGLTFAASTSTLSICGGRASSSGALAISAAAIRPSRWALRPASSAKASKMPKEEGPSLMANHTGVFDSWLARVNAPLRRASTSASLPGLSSS